MTEPAYRVLTLVRGMVQVNRAEAAAVEVAGNPGDPGDPDRAGLPSPDEADRIAEALAAAEAQFGPAGFEESGV